MLGDFHLLDAAVRVSELSLMSLKQEDSRLTERSTVTDTVFTSHSHLLCALSLQGMSAFLRSEGARRWDRRRVKGLLHSTRLGGSLEQHFDDMGPFPDLHAHCTVLHPNLPTSAVHSIPVYAA